MFLLRPPQMESGVALEPPGKARPPIAGGRSKQKESVAGEGGGWPQGTEANASSIGHSFAAVSPVEHLGVR